MKLKDSFKFLLWKGVKDILIIAVVAIVTGGVLALILKPSGVEAQTTYDVNSTDIQTPQVKDSTNNNQSNPDDLCAGIENSHARNACITDQVMKAGTGDPTLNQATMSGQSELSKAIAMNVVLFGVPDASQSQAMSPVWQHIYASIPALSKNGLVGLTMESATYAMLFQPLPLAQPVTFYAQTFIPKVIREGLSGSSSVYASFLSSTLNELDQEHGNPPDGTNSFKYLNSFIGSFWMAIFKLTTGIFVIILVIAGIMIILRQKIGQNVVTVYMALKNLVIGYVGAFLSLGLGAFFFTFSKWLMLVLASLVIQIRGGGNKVIFMDGLLGTSLAYAIHSWDNGITSWAKSVFGGDFKTIILHFANPFNLFKVVVGGFIAELIPIFLGAAILFIFAKLFIKVIQIYVSMLIDTVIAPIFFLLGSIPGNESTISDWFKRMFKNSLKIPLMFFIVNIGYALITLPTPPNGLRFVTGGALGTGDPGSWFNIMGLYNIIPLVVISSANGIDKVIEQMFGGPSKTAGLLSEGAKSMIKGVPGLGSIVG